MIKKTETPKFDSFRKMGRGLAGIRKSIHWRTLNFYVFSFFVLVLALSTAWTNPKPMQAEGPYIITATAGTGGLISPLGVKEKAEGESQDYIIAADPNFSISDVLVDGESVGITSTYTFTDIRANHTISAMFAYKVTITKIDSTHVEGRDDCRNDVTPTEAFVAPGSDLWLTITSDYERGCFAESMKVGAVGIDDYMGQDLYNVRDYIHGNVSVEVTFKRYPLYTVTAETDGHGIVIPPNTVNVYEGRSVSFLVSANSGYELSGVSIDGGALIPLGHEAGGYSIDNVYGNSLLHFTFIPEVTRYDITSSIEQGYKPYPCGGGRKTRDCRLWGKILSSSTGSIVEGDSRTYTISYTKVGTIRNTSIIYRDRLVDVLVDGVSVGPVETYTFSNVRANHNIKAIIAEYFDVNVINPSSGGTITPSGVQQVNYAENFYFEVRPNRGFDVSDVLAGGSSILKSNCTISKGSAACALGGVQENTTIEASFTAQVPKIRESIAPPTPETPVITNPTQSISPTTRNVITNKEENSIPQAVVAAIKNIIKETPPSVAYTFPYLLFVLLGIMAIVLIYQTKREANQTQEVMRLIELDKSVAQQKDNFIMLSSHYVRTPMTVIVTGTELFLSLGKLAQNVAKSIREALDGLANTVKATFSDIENNVFLKIIKDKGADNELKKAYLSPYLWIPIILIAGLVFLANYLFESVAKININIINYICEALVFVIASQIFFVFYRKKRLEKANHLKSTLILNKQIIIDNARNDFMKKTAKDIKEKINKLEKALARSKSRKNLEEVEKGIRDLKKMISKFELLSQIGAGKLKVVSTEFGLLGLVSGMTQERQKKLQEKKIKLKFDQKDMVIKTDKRKLAIILGNILNNAIEYNKTNGNIKIGFEKDQNKTSITIEDNGVGISKKAQENLFKPFSRGTSTLQFDYEGMGTSLYISKTMANYLGGDISIESTEGKGTKVTVLINS